jgi:hypothetical protein
VNVDKVRLSSGKTIPASKYGQSSEETAAVDYSDDDLLIIEKIKVPFDCIEFD